MKNKEFRKLLKKNKPNAGFTLFELLVGLAISGVVIGALGFGLVTVLSNTQTQTAKTKARSETSRAMEFITEELKSALAIEVDTSLANLQTADNPATPDIDEAIAPSYVPKNDGTADEAIPILALRIPNVAERVIYSIGVPEASSPWKGPLVIYRWGPNLNADGSYSDPGDVTNWDNEALIDGVSDTDQTASCGGVDNVTYQGFYACLLDDDGDGITTTAQLFFTGDIKNTSNPYDNKYSADTKVSTRVKEADVNNQEDRLEDTVGFTSLGATYSCNTSGDWKVRTDFGNDPSDPDNTTKWIHQDNRQPQPLKVNTSNDLVITTSAIAPDGSSNCISLGNEFRSDGVTPTDRKGSDILAYDGYDPDNDPTTTANQQQAIADFLISKGYAVQDGTTYRLFEGKDDPLLNIPGHDGYDSSKPTSIILADNERIISLELGQFDNGKTQSTNPDAADYNDVTDDGVDQDDYYDTDGDGEMHPGFDGQDNVIIITNDKFDTTTD